MSTYPLSVLILSFIGLLVLSYLFLSFVHLVVQIALAPRSPKTNKLLTVRLGTWAIVTGASDGIGKQFAIQLAECGFNVVLLSRSIDRLELVAKEIRALKHLKSTVDARVYPFDFSKADEKDWTALKAMISKLDVGYI